MLFQLAHPLAVLVLGVHLMTKIRNATGPRTVVGKRRSSRNATKFGIFSKSTLLEGESRADYESLRQAFWKSKPPRDKFQEIMLDKMVSNFWRQSRVLIAEGAEIRKSSEFVESDRRQKELKEAEETGESPFGGLISSIENPDVLERCLEILVELRQGIKDFGFDMLENKWRLKKIYGLSGMEHLRETLQGKYSSLFDTAAVTDEVRKSEGYFTPEQCKQHMLQAIDAEINRLREYKEKYNLIESKRMEVEILRQRVPDSPGLDRLLRYARGLERAFDRMLTQYDRAQRMRKGQPPPQSDGKIS
jgi:hypothetical protein